MKISGNTPSLMPNMSEIQTAGNKLTAQTGLVEVGQILEGNVLNGSGKNVILSMAEGLSLSLILENPEALTLNTSSEQSLKVEVTEVQEGQVKGKIIEMGSNLGETAKETPVNTRLDHILSKLGVDPSPRYREALNALIKFGIPVHQEGLNQLKLESQLIDKMSQLVDTVPENELVEVKAMPLKEAVKQLLQALNANPGVNTHPGHNVNQNPAPTLNITQMSQNIQITQDPETHLEGKVEKEITSSTQTVVESEIELESDEKLVKTFSKIVQETLQNGIHAEKSALLKTLDVQTTIQNLVLSDHLLGREMGHERKMNLSDLLTQLTDQLDKLLNGLEGKDKSAFMQISNIIKEMDARIPTDLEGHQGLLKELDDAVQQLLSDSGTPTEVKKLLIEQSDLIQTLKDGFDFLKQASQTLGFVQLKMMYDGEPAQFEMAYKRKKKEPGEGERIFISLDTHHIGTVQSLIDLKQNGVTIQFHVDNQRVKERFEASFTQLKEEIQSVLDHQGKAYTIVIRMYGEEMMVKSLFMNERAVDQISGFDVRV